MNEKQYEFLSKFKDNMRLAQEAGYSRNIRKAERVKIKEILETLSKEKFTKNIYCSSCLAEMLVSIKKYFDKYEEKRNKKIEELNNVCDAETEKEGDATTEEV